MKHFKNFLLVGAVALASALSARAQSVYGNSTMVQVDAPRKITTTGQQTVNVTNTPIDVRGFQGVCSLVIVVVSNSADVATLPAMVVTAETANTNGNVGTLWTNLTSEALSVQTDVVLTNFPNNYSLTNRYWAAGIDFTNTTSFTANGTVIKEYGVDAFDNSSLRINYSLTGSNANFTVFSFIRGKRIPY